MASSIGSTVGVTANVWFAMTAGKGDHRHYGEHEEPYPFSNFAALTADFRADCTRLAVWSWADEQDRD